MRYEFPPIPIENQDCAQRLALANAFPARVGFALRGARIALPKRPGGAQGDAAPVTAADGEEAQEAGRSRRRVSATSRSCSAAASATSRPRAPPTTCPRLRRSLPEERQLLLIDDKINTTGVHANIPFLEAARDLAVTERNAVNTRLDELTAGVITSFDRCAGSWTLVNACGQEMTSPRQTLSRRDVLAHEPAGFVREFLELRQRGAASTVASSRDAGLRGRRPAGP